MRGMLKKYRPEELARLSKQRKKEGFLVFPIDDKIALGEWYARRHDLSTARQIFQEATNALDARKLTRAPKLRTGKAYARFLQRLQDPATGG